MNEVSIITGEVVDTYFAPYFLHMMISLRGDDGELHHVHGHGPGWQLPFLQTFHVGQRRTIVAIKDQHGIWEIP